MRVAAAIALLAALLPLAGTFSAAAQDETPEERQIRFADGLLKRGFYEEAADEYKKYLADFPEGSHAADASYRLGESLFGNRDVEAAANAFAAFIKKYPDHVDVPQAQLRQAECMYRLGRGSEILPVLQKLAASEGPAQSGACYFAGRIQYDEGDLEGAAASLSRFSGDLAGTSHAPFGQYQCAVVYEDLERFEDAAAMFLTASRSLEGALSSDAAMNAGRIFMRVGEPGRAADLYNTLSTVDDEVMAQSAGMRLPWAWIEAGEYDKALEAIAKFRNRFTDMRAGEVALAEGRALEGKGAMEASRAAYQRATEARVPEYAGRAHYRLAKILYGDEKFAEALDAIKKAMAKLGDSPEWMAAAILLEGDTHRAAGDAPNAEAAYTRINDEFADTSSAPTAFMRLGEIALAKGEVEKAVAQFDALAKATPESPMAQRAQLAAADALFGAAQFDDAAKRFETIQASLHDDASQELRSSIVMRCAAAHFNAGNSEKATEWYQRVLNLTKDSAAKGEIYVRLGEMMVDSNPEEATKQFRAALETNAVDPWPGRARAGLGLALYEQESYDEAAKVLGEVVSKHPTVALSPTAYAWLGQRLFDAEDYAGSAVVFEAMIAAHPEDPRRTTANLLLGRAHARLKKYEDAQRAFQNAVDADDANTEALYRLGLVLEQVQKLEEAKASFEKAAQLEGDWSAAARLGWARVLHREEDYAGAARQYMLIGIVYQDPIITPRALHGAALCYKALNDDKAKDVRAELAAAYPNFTPPEDPFAVPEVSP